MNTLDLLKDHPKAALVIKQFYLDIMLKSLENKDIPDDFKMAVKSAGIDDARVASLMETTPRGMFDMFDNQKIYIQISVLPDVGKFWYSINGKDGDLRYDDRRETEKQAVFLAFKLLNDKL